MLSKLEWYADKPGKHGLITLDPTDTNTTTKAAKEASQNKALQERRKPFFIDDDGWVNFSIPLYHEVSD